MPIDYSKYPANWKSEIRPAVLERAKHCCEQCGIKNYSVGYWDKSGKFWTVDMIMNLLEETGYDIFDKGHELGHISELKKCVKVVLTVAHLDHNTNNNVLSNLRSLCQWHHLHYDRELHKENSRNTRNKNKGLQNLF